MIELLIEWADDIHPINSLHDVEGLIYVVRNHGDTEFADRLEQWKYDLEMKIKAEHCTHPMDFATHHRDNPMRWTCGECGTVTLVLT